MHRTRARFIPSITPSHSQTPVLEAERTCLGGTERINVAGHGEVSSDEFDALVAYLPGPAIGRIADLRASEATTDARDAAIVAEPAPRLGKNLAAEIAPPLNFDGDFVALFAQGGELLG